MTRSRRLVLIVAGAAPIVVSVGACAKSGDDGSRDGGSRDGGVVVVPGQTVQGEPLAGPAGAGTVDATAEPRAVSESDVPPFSLTGEPLSFQ